ncbi:hypothetical protein K1719_005275 [Acacia pycnantha]|nr:hypothetical protein K1719_005275 [Acacia pycnantha]
MINGVPKKRPRPTPTRQNGSCCAVIDSSFSDESLCVVSKKPRIRSSPCIDGSSATTTPSFNDSSTADVILRLFVDSASPLGSSFSSDSGSVDPAVSTSDLHVYLHSDILRLSKYFSVILSDRWNGQSRPQESDGLLKLNLEVPLTSGAIQSHLTVLELLYTNDFANTIDSASTALDLLPVALELLFEECVRSCVTFLEAVPWSEEEEGRVLNLIPFLCEEEAKELLARVSPVREDSYESMLEGLISSAIHNYQNTALVKAFVAKILRDFSSRESAKRVLEKAFKTSLQTAKECLEEYSSPDFRGTIMKRRPYRDFICTKR